MAFSDTIGLLFSIRADGDQAVREMNRVRKEEKEMEGTTSSLSSSFASMANPAAIAATALTAIAAAAVAGTVALFELAKSTGEYGDEIFDAAQKTNAGTDTLQALKFAAEQSGSSFEAMSKSLTKFSTLLGQAASGNLKAQAILEKYHITATDVDGALAQAINTINRMSDANQQNAAAAELFKDKAGNVINVIREMNGDLPGTIQKLKDMGVLMGKDDVEAGAKFTDMLDTLNKQLAGVGRTIGSEVLPIFLKLATSLSDWLKANQSEVKAWGNAFGGVLKLVIDYMRVFYNIETGLMDALVSGAKIAAAVVGRNVTEAGLLFDAFAKRQEERLKIIGERLADMGNILTGKTTPAGQPVGQEAAGGTGFSIRDQDEIDAAKKKAEEIAKLREAAYKREFAALSQQNQLLIEAARTTLDATLETQKELLKSGENGLNQYIKNTAATIEEFKKKTRSLIDEQFKREAAGKTQTERDNLELERSKALNAMLRLSITYKKEATATVEEQQDVNRKYFREQVLQAEELIKLEEKKNAAIWERIRLENDARAGPAGPSIAPPQLIPEESGLNQDIFGVWKASWGDFFGKWKTEVGIMDTMSGTVSQSLSGMADILQRAFEGVVQALGSVVEQWVLYGKTAPAIMRKILASALATIAAEAAVQAIKAAAWGFYYLATQDYASAGNAFVSAALFGSLAGGAALAGRAIAGNTFNQQTAGATGAAAGSSAGTSRSGTYSGQEDQVIDISRNAPWTQPATVVIQDKTGIMGKLLEWEIGNNSRVRSLIVETASS